MVDSRLHHLPLQPLWECRPPFQVNPGLILQWAEGRRVVGGATRRPSETFSQKRKVSIVHPHKTTLLLAPNQNLNITSDFSPYREPLPRSYRQVAMLVPGDRDL